VKKQRENFSHCPLNFAPYLAQRSPPKSKPAIFPQSSSSPSYIQSHGWSLCTDSDEELGGGFRRRPFSFFANLCSSGSSSGGCKNSQTLAVVDV
jgi:hypothetical protein